MPSPVGDKKKLALVALVCVSLLSFPFTVQAASTDPHTFSTEWGSSGTGDGQFDAAPGLDVDSSNNVYVVDYLNERVQKFNSSGTFITKWGSTGSGDGQFSQPIDVAVDSNDNVYVTDRANYRVQKFTSSGTFVTEWGSEGSGDGQFEAPFGIAIDSSDNVYVTDQSLNYVQKFNTSGTYISTIGSSGSGDGQFSQPMEIATDSSNNIYVTDPDTDRVQKFNSSGTFVTKWGSTGSGNGQFNAINGVAVDSHDNIYIGDSFNFRIQKFDSDGTYLTQWGSEGTGNGQFTNGGDVSIFLAIDSDDNVYATDSWADRVQKFAAVDSPASTTTTTAISLDLTPNGLSTPANSGNTENKATLGKKTITSAETVEVKWDRPSDTSTIDQYFIYYREIGDKKWIEKKAKPTDDSIDFDPDEGKYEWYLKIKYTDGGSSETDIYTVEIDSSIEEGEKEEKIEISENVIDLDEEIVYLPLGSPIAVNPSTKAADVVVEIWNRDQTIHYDTMVCGVGLCDHGHILNGDLTLIVYTEDEAGNKSEEREVIISPFSSGTSDSQHTVQGVQTVSESSENIPEETPAIKQEIPESKTEAQQLPTGSPPMKLENPNAGSEQSLLEKIWHTLFPNF